MSPNPPNSLQFRKQSSSVTTIYRCSHLATILTDLPTCTEVGLSVSLSTLSLNPPHRVCTQPTVPKDKQIYLFEDNQQSFCLIFLSRTILRKKQENREQIFSSK
ncbi:hypothetical protein L1887_30485 [Cichorium endivia]|nr:hypothetical protein L1887_30485 [Cichorium endivia]